MLIDYDSEISQAILRQLKGHPLNQDEIDDLHQELIITLLKVNAEDKSLGYFIRSARNKAFSYRRNQARRKDHNPLGGDLTLESNHPTYDPTNEIIADLCRQDLIHQLRQINLIKPYKELLEHILDNPESNYEDLSKVFGVPVGTIKSRFHRLREALKEARLTQW